MHPHRSLTDPAIQRALTSDTFSIADVQEILSTEFHALSGMLLTAVRLESEERFWSAVRLLVDNMPWKGTPAERDQDYHEWFWQTLMLFAHRWYEPRESVNSMPQPPEECACEHLTFQALHPGDFLLLDHTPELVYAMMRSLELGDPEAQKTAASLLAKSNPKYIGGMARCGDEIGAQRMHEVFAPILGSTDAERLRALPDHILRSACFVSLNAKAIAQANRMKIDEIAIGGYSSYLAARRLLLQAAAAFDKGDLFFDILQAVAKLPGNSLECFDVPWESEQEVHSATDCAVVARLGKSLFSATVKYDRDGLPTKGLRASCKSFPSVEKAKASLTKRLEELAAKIKGKPEPRKRGGHVSDPTKALLRLEVLDDYAATERMIPLLACGADPNAINSDGETTLQRHITNPEAVRRLLVAGADPNVVSKAGKTALDSAIEISECGPVLRQSIELLAAAGGRCDARALHHVAQNGNSRVVPLLVRAGADPTAVVDGRTALDVARENRFVKTTAALQALL